MLKKSIKIFKNLLYKNIHIYKFIREVFHTTRYISCLILIKFNTRFIYNLVYFNGSSLEIRFISKQLIKVIKNLSTFNLDSLYILAAYFYLTGYFYIARNIYKHIYFIRHEHVCSLSSSEISKVRKVITPKFFYAIGHMAYIDTLLKENFLRTQSFNNIILTGTELDYSNVNLFRAYSTILSTNKNVENEELNNPIYLHQDLSFNLSESLEWFDEWSWRIQKTWINNYGYSTLLNISDDSFKESIDILKNFGVTTDDWFVVLHLRENSGSKLMNLRDVQPNTYRKSILRIIAKGGFVFRVGTSKLHDSININSDHFIDLTNKDCIQKKLDLYLLSKCRFFLGTGSGPSSIASQVFHRPLLSTNIGPLASRIPFNNHLILPKTYKNTVTGYEMNYKDRINPKFGNLESRDALNRLGFYAVENSENELLDACNEMLFLTDNTNYQYIYDLPSFKKVEYIQNNSLRKKISPCAIARIVTIKKPNFLEY